MYHTVSIITLGRNQVRYLLDQPQSSADVTMAPPTTLALDEPSQPQTSANAILVGDILRAVGTTQRRYIGPASAQDAEALRNSALGDYAQRISDTVSGVASSGVSVSFTPLVTKTLLPSLDPKFQSGLAQEPSKVLELDTLWCALLELLE